MARPAGFASPAAALAQIVECLDGFCERVHSGSFGSGASIDCCPCLLRVETAGARQIEGPVSLVANVGKCHTLILDIAITYSECFAVLTKSSNPMPIADMTSQGLDMMQSWWTALQMLSCCEPSNQMLRFASIVELAPEGQCASWVMMLECDIKFCSCP